MKREKVLWQMGAVSNSKETVDISQTERRHEVTDGRHTEGKKGKQKSRLSSLTSLDEWMAEEVQEGMIRGKHCLELQRLKRCGETSSPI